MRNQTAVMGPRALALLLTAAVRLFTVDIDNENGFPLGYCRRRLSFVGTSSVARGMSGYIDELSGNKISTALKETMGMNVDFLSDYPDFFSFVVVLILAALLAYGVKESTLMNNIFTGVNLCVIAIVLVAGGMNCVEAGAGGFAPYGFAGIMAGAAKCFYGFVGFDCIATTGEEAKNPSRNIPLAIVISLIIIFLAYFGISTVLTMALPYYLQNPDAPFPHLFEQLGWHAIKWIVSIGAIFALCTSLLGAMFPLPRVLYAMSSDGIIYKKLRTVHPKTQTPVLATILAGLLAATMAMLFNLQQLIDMMSIGTLLAYTIVAVSVLVLRYEDQTLLQSTTVTIPNVFRQLFNVDKLKDPSSLSSGIVKVGICLFGGFSWQFSKFMSIFGGIQRRYGGVFGGFEASQVRGVLEGGLQGISRRFRSFSAGFRSLTEALQRSFRGFEPF
ncbi:hypothetical protein RP20_CCG005769 [Aedes albopictus]|nr:hypothetical protein RP20_CCG005769 [Aedes albopictus]